VKPEPVKLMVYEEAIEEAAEYIYNHYTSQITLKEVAGRIHMSPAYFSRKFKAVTGFGYKEYLTNIRIREAVGLLLNTAKSITDIAVECGFGDGNYFGDAFKKIKGVSPRVFRRMKGII
jgi:YesN/AraC family two-component response regulator